MTSNPDYYFDNIVVKAHYTEQGHFEPRPIAEKKADALNAFDKYVQILIATNNGDPKQMQAAYRNTKIRQVVK